MNFPPVSSRSHSGQKGNGTIHFLTSDSGVKNAVSKYISLVPHARHWAGGRLAERSLKSCSTCWERADMPEYYFVSLKLTVQNCSLVVLCRWACSAEMNSDGSTGVCRTHCELGLRTIRSQRPASESLIEHTTIGAGETCAVIVIVGRLLLVYYRAIFKHFRPKYFEPWAILRFGPRGKTKVGSHGRFAWSKR